MVDNAALESTLWLQPTPILGAAITVKGEAQIVVAWRAVGTGEELGLKTTDIGGGAKDIAELVIEEPGIAGQDCLGILRPKPGNQALRLAEAGRNGFGIERADGRNMHGEHRVAWAEQAMPLAARERVH
jgi:hypothetical protein